MLGLLLVILEFVLPLSMRIPVLRVIASVGVLAIRVADWRTANRWERERTGTDRLVRPGNYPLTVGKSSGKMFLGSREHVENHQKTQG